MGNNTVQIFNHVDFGSVRVVDVDGTPYFAGKDIAERLGYSNASKAVLAHVDADDKMFVMMNIADSQNGNVPLGQTKTTIINESGLYSLILSSKLPSAKRFKKWITSEVLPSLRKHGMYAKDELLDNPDLLLDVVQKLKAERDIRLQLEQENQKKQAKIIELQPKANYYDLIMRSKNTMAISIIAKDYGMTAIEMNRILEKMKVQYKQGGIWLLHKKYADKGYTQSSTTAITHGDGTVTSKLHTKWTQTGRVFLYELLKEDGILPLIERNIA